MSDYQNTNNNYPKKSSYGKGYGKRPLWQWILLYVAVGAIVYAAIYYFYSYKSGGYSPNQNTSPYGVQNTPSY